MQGSEAGYMGCFTYVLQSELSSHKAVEDPESSSSICSWPVAVLSFIQC